MVTLLSPLGRDIEAAQSLVKGLLSDLEKSQAVEAERRAELQGAIARLAAASYSSGVATANLIAAEAALDRLKPGGSCRTAGCWSRQVSGGMGQCFEHSPQDAPCRQDRVR